MAKQKQTTKGKKHPNYRVHVSNSTKRKIFAIMDNLFETENHRVPYTDKELADELNAQGIDVSVTTVAYYREITYGLPNFLERAKLYRQQQGAKGAKSNGNT